MSAEFLNSLSNDFAKLLFNVEDYNVIIKVGRSPNILNFKAHSCVLRTRSTYFHSALSNDWVKTDGNFIAFEKSNISPEVFQMILKYLYSGTICLENQNPTRVIDLIAAADELILTELVNFLKEYLLTHYDEWIRQHALQILYHTAFHSCKELQDICLEMICENPSSVFGTTAFSAIDESVLITILKRDDLQMDEIDLWDYLIQWAIARTPKLKFDVSKWSDGDFQVLQSTLKNCMPLIKFNHINPNKIPIRLNHFNRIITCNTDSLPDHQTIILDNLFDSNLIKLKHATVISHWIDRIEDPEQTQLYRKSPSHSFKLLLRGSRDGFSARKFHELCKDKGATVVIMKIAGTGEVIGGFNPENWKGGFFGNWVKSMDSFIFSLGVESENLKNSKLSRIKKNHSRMAVFSADVRGPCFGNRDLWMSNYNNLSKGCSSRNSYYEKNLIDSQEFDLEDYEVFQIFHQQSVNEKTI